MNEGYMLLGGAKTMAALELAVLLDPESLRTLSHKKISPFGR